MRDTEMNRSILTAAVGVTLAIALAAGAIAVLDPFGPSWVDPETARCDDPATAVVSERDSSDHREIDLTFTCEAAVQAATIYLPPEAGQHPAVVWVHGAGNASRIVYDFPLFTHLVQHGIAVLTYDKRGVSRSAGVCCPGDDGHFNLLTADVEGAMAVLRSRPEVDGEQIGLIGPSQAGWIAPRAAVEADAAFVVLAAAPSVGERIANRYERLSSGAEGDLSPDEIAQRLKGSDVGYDPLPYLQRLSTPSLWLYGTADDRTPVEESIAVLDQLKSDGHDITVVEYSGAGHGLFDTPSTAPAAMPTALAWILDHVRL
jgi:dipeptidyl aminopeptidase/acylaminoacyl peptidase